ncbi:MAG TPA: hypothetical protein VF746_13075 [Longimicrobium sp.]|jgi:hypothetical protein
MPLPRLPRLRPSRALRPLALALALVPAAHAAAGAQVIWRGRSGGFDITWDTSDVSARRVGDGRLVFSLKQAFDAERAGRTGDDDPPIREEMVTYRLLSVVGSIVSLEQYWYCDCGGAHPISGRGFVSYDLARSTPARPHPVRITELVPEAPLLRALTADRLIRGVMDSVDVRTARSLAALVDTLKYQGTFVATPDDDEQGMECSYSVGESFPSDFALHHVENGQLAIRFSLSHSVEICRGRMVQVGVLVPVPPRLQPALMAADARRSGYLMKDVRRIAGDRETRIEWEAK